MDDRTETDAAFETYIGNNDIRRVTMPISRTILYSTPGGALTREEIISSKDFREYLDNRTSQATIANV